MDLTLLTKQAGPLNAIISGAKGALNSVRALPKGTKQNIGQWGTATGYAALMDGLFNKFEYEPESWNKRRVALDIWNLLGTKKGLNMMSPIGKRTSIASSVGGGMMLGSLPVKDLTFYSGSELPGVADAFKKSVDIQDKANTLAEKALSLQSASQSTSTDSDHKRRLATYLLGGGALALGTLGIGSLLSKNRAEQNQPKGKLRVTLPTKDPRDAETSIELPISETGLSGAQLSNISRDIRRRVRRESKERIQHRLKRPEASPEQDTDRPA